MTAEIRIRRADPADAAEIGRLTREAYAPWVALIGREPKPMGVDYEAAMVTHRFDLLQVGDSLAGLIETVEEADQLLVVNVAVAPAFQGEGLGRRLLGPAEEIARDRGYERIRLYTNQLFTRNIQLYRRLGYVVDREEALGGGVAVHMSKPLSRAKTG